MGRANERSGRLDGILRRVGAVVVFAGLVMSVLPLVAGAEHVDTWPDSSDANHPDYWEAWGLSEESEDDWTCVKDDAGGDGPYEVGAPPSGEVWRLLVVKAGSGVNDLHWSPLPGDEYEHSIQGGWSHVILCSVPEEDGTTTTVADTTTTVADTTTTVADTTTTVADEVLPVVVTSSTVAPTSTVADEVEGTQVVSATLPFTGPTTEGFGQAGLALLALGALLVAATSRRYAAQD